MKRTAGRPLRFLGLVLGGWTALRIALLLPEAARLPELIAPRASAADGGLASVPPRLLGEWPAPPPRSAALDAAAPGNTTIARELGRSRGNLAPSGQGMLSVAQRQPDAVLNAPYRPGPAPPSAPDAPRRAASRLSGTGWLALRQGRGDGLGPGGQLGGSQAGVRLRYALGESRRVALSARFSSPLRGRGAEAALGVEWRPTRAPVSVIAEQRIGLDGSPGGPTLMALGGINPTPVAAGFSLEGYGQGGAVLRRQRVEPFADGALRLARPVTRGGALTLGAGAWGAVQRDAGRLDIGPSLAVAIPAGPQNLRLTIDWRQRIAGDASPESGLAVTLGSDF